MGSGEMIIQVFPACPLFTEDEQTYFEDICKEFVSGTSRLCTDKEDYPFHLKSKILAMFRVNTTPGCYK
jgi:hypothetical protein